MPEPLTDRESKILDIAARNYLHESSREDAAWSELGMRWFPYIAALNALIDTPSAQSAHPITTRILRGRRELRIRA